MARKNLLCDTTSKFEIYFFHNCIHFFKPDELALSVSGMSHILPSQNSLENTWYGQLLENTCCATRNPMKSVNFISF